MKRLSMRERGGITAKLIGLLCFVLVLGTLYLVRRPLLRSVGEGWLVEDPLEKSDAIVVLSIDNFYADRATRAAEVYRQGLAPLVVASGVRLRPYAGIGELMEHDLIERRVPKEKVDQAIYGGSGRHAGGDVGIAEQGGCAYDIATGCGPSGEAGTICGVAIHATR